MTQDKSRDGLEGSNGQKEPYASCQNCKYCRKQWGCYLRSDVAMFEDKSPCMVWDDGKDN
jgi:hypothetical protein